jgi:hypothetical protein
MHTPYMLLDLISTASDWCLCASALGACNNIISDARTCARADGIPNFSLVHSLSSRVALSTWLFPGHRVPGCVCWSAHHLVCRSANARGRMVAFMRECGGNHFSCRRERCWGCNELERCCMGQVLAAHLRFSATAHLTVTIDARRATAQRCGWIIFNLANAIIRHRMDEFPNWCAQQTDSN